MAVILTLANRFDSPIDERSLQIDLVRLDWAVPVAGCVRSRKPRASASTQRLAAQLAEASSPEQHRPGSACWALSPDSRGSGALKIIRPETLMRWHRAGLRAYWRWESRPRGGRPTTPADICRLIREMSVANPLWGAPRIHGELLKLGIRRTDHGRKVHGEEENAAVAGLEDLPSQSCRRHRIDGSVPGPDDFVSAVVRIPDPAKQSS